MGRGGVVGCGVVVGRGGGGRVCGGGVGRVWVVEWVVVGWE